MNSSKYFLKGTLLGLVCAFLLTYALMSDFIFNFLTFPRPGVSVLLAIALMLLASNYFDRKQLNRSFLTYGMAIPFAVFLTGALSGGCINFFLEAVSSGAWSKSFFDYFFKPFFWLCYLGAPSSLIVGSAYYLACSKQKGPSN